MCQAVFFFFFLFFFTLLRLEYLRSQYGCAHLHTQTYTDVCAKTLLGACNNRPSCKKSAGERSSGSLMSKDFIFAAWNSRSNVDLREREKERARARATESVPLSFPSRTRSPTLLFSLSPFLPRSSHIETPSIYPSLCLSLYLSLYPSVSPSISQSTSLSFYLPVSLYLSISLYLSMSLPTYLPLSQSSYLSISL